MHRIQETQAALGVALWSAVQERLAAARPLVPDAVSDAGDREAAVLDRIAAFRRRRPRLTDEVVTLAHGAGGKASAALVDAVFLDAFVDGERGAARPTRRSSALPGGDRLAFSTDSFVVQPRASPVARSGTSRSTAPSTTSPCRAAGRRGSRRRS